MWKKRKKNRKRKVGAAGYVRDPERKLRFFFSRPCTFEPASGFSHAFLRNYRCQDYREGRLCVYCFAVEYGERRPGHDEDFDPCLRFLRASACVSRRTISLSRLRYDDLRTRGRNRIRDRFDMRG